MVSSVTLKSPNIKSGLHSLYSCLRVSTLFQNSGWDALVCGAYMLSSVVSSFSCHCTFRARARPSNSSKIVMLLGLIRRLFIAKATPADARGVSGSGEDMMVRRLPNDWFTRFSRSSSKWASWIAKIAIFCMLIILFTADHFSIPVIL